MKSSSVIVFVILFTSLIIPTFDQNVYGTSATGGTITYDGDYTVHTFTTSGTLTVTSGGSADYLVVGGGGAGGYDAAGDGGGGGAGGFLNGTTTLTVQSYSIIVGAGGAAGSGTGANGGNSTFSTFNAAGGGGGGKYTASGSGANGVNGGSGGGGGQNQGQGGTGIVGQGNDGGDLPNHYGGGGGGGASAAGGNPYGGGNNPEGGAGGDGLSTSISGVSTAYAGGGGGFTHGTGTGTKPGGVGGGGTGGYTAIAGTAGTDGLGGGGGAGGAGNAAGDGGDGIVIIRYLTPPTPDAVDDLTLVSESFGTVIMSWTEPNLNGGNLTGYQINYSTPFGQPLTVITENTGSSDTSTTVTGLNLGAPYTFGVSAVTEGPRNGTHPPMSWLNVTTSGNFTIGTAAFNQTNNEVLPITFETQDVNSTAIFLNVTFSNAYDLACDFNYKYAITNQTYKDLDSYAVSTTLNETSFLFNNVTNEVIAVDCWDQNTGTDADYILTISDFPLLQQIQDFRNGEFGTMGKIGVFDVVTLFVVIISMIGLNRVNESVGIVFNVALLGSLAYFEIIELPTVIFGVLALVMVFVITSTRKG